MRVTHFDLVIQARNSTTDCAPSEASALTAEVVGWLSLMTPGLLRCILEISDGHLANAVIVVVNVNEVLEGHVALDIQCLDRIYLNGYVPNLRVGGQVFTLLTKHLGYRIPSPAVLEKIGTAFHRSVNSPGRTARSM